jgi:zinc protease
VLDKRMVIEVSASYDMTSFDPGMFTLSAQMRPGVKTDDAIAEADKVIEQLKDHPVGDEELQKAKNLEQSSFVFAQDSIFEEALQLGVWEMLGDYHLMDRYLGEIDKVTAADVQRVAKKYLVENNCTLGVLVPTGILPHEEGGGAGGMVHHAPALRTGDSMPEVAPMRVTRAASAMDEVAR